MQDRMVSDGHVFAHFIARHGDRGRIRRRPAQLFALIMKSRGKQPKRIVLKMKASPALVNAAFAQDDVCAPWPSASQTKAHSLKPMEVLMAADVTGRNAESTVKKSTGQEVKRVRRLILDSLTS